MPNLELSEQENKILIELLESAISDLGGEIADTKSADFRKGLKLKKSAAMAMLERLQKATG